MILQNDNYDATNLNFGHKKIVYWSPIKVVSKFSWISERVRWIKIALKILILSERVTHNSRWFTT